MKKSVNYILALVIGIIIGYLVNRSISCDKKSSFTAPPTAALPVKGSEFNNLENGRVLIRLPGDVLFRQVDRYEISDMEKLKSEGVMLRDEQGNLISLQIALERINNYAKMAHDAIKSKPQFSERVINGVIVVQPSTPNEIKYQTWTYKSSGMKYGPFKQLTTRTIGSTVQMQLMSIYYLYNSVK